MDKRFAGKLALRLAQFKQLRIWIDQAEIKPGDSLTQLIGRALDSMDVLCVVLSPDAAVSEWVAKEVGLARRRYSKLRNIRIIPLIHKPTVVPRSLSDWLFLDFSDEANFEGAVGSLVEALGVFKLPDDPQTDEEIDIRLDDLASGYALLGGLLAEARRAGGIPNAATGSLANSRIPDAFVDQFLLLLATRYPGLVRFGIALTAVELIDSKGVGRTALDYCLLPNKLQSSERDSVGTAMSLAKDHDAIVYLHGVFVRNLNNDATYHTFVQKHFSVLREYCYDDVRRYLLIPDRGPKSYNWDSAFEIISVDPEALDFKKRIQDWINNGEFENKANRVVEVVYRYLNRVIENNSENTWYLVDLFEARVRSLLVYGNVNGAIYHISAIISAEYRRISEVMRMVVDRTYSAEASGWTKEQAEMIKMQTYYMQCVERGASAGQLIDLRFKMHEMADRYNLPRC